MGGGEGREGRESQDGRDLRCRDLGIKCYSVGLLTDGTLGSLVVTLETIEFGKLRCSNVECRPGVD